MPSLDSIRATLADLEHASPGRWRRMQTGFVIVLAITTAVVLAVGLR